VGTGCASCLKLVPATKLYEVQREELDKTFSNEGVVNPSSKHTVMGVTSCTITRKDIPISLVFYKNIHVNSTICDNITFFERMNSDQRKSAELNGYHNMKEGIRSTHSHSCNYCGNSYEHTHNIKSHYMQYLYDNICNDCEKNLQRHCLPDLIGSWAMSELPTKVELLQQKAQILQEKANISMPDAHKFFHWIVGVDPESNKEKEYTMHLSDIEYALGVTDQIYTRMKNMSTWEMYVGLPFVGKFGPITSQYIVSDDLSICQVLGNLTYIGNDAVRYRNSIIGTQESKYQDLYLFAEALEKERIKLGDNLPPEFEEVYRRTTIVMEKIRAYIIKRIALAGYVPVMDDDVVSHIHYSKGSKYDFQPIQVRELCNIRVFRAHDGYLAFVREGEVYDKQRLISYMNSSPFNHVKWVDFIVDHSERCNIDQLLELLQKEPGKLETEVIYNQLVYALANCEFQSNKYYSILNYLKLAHFYRTGERASCKAYIFSGSPGVGKSYDVMKIAGVKKNVYYYSYDHKTKQYFDGYKGQSVMVIDDLGHHTQDEWLILLKLITDAPYKLPMARAEIKDMIPSLIEEIYITTNCIDKLLKLDVVTRDAICRRCEVFKYTDDGIEHQLYNKPSGCYTSIQILTRDTMYDYFKQYVHCYRQEPHLASDSTSAVWAGLHFAVDILVGIRVEFKILRQFLNVLMGVDKFRQHLPSFISTGITTIVSLCKRKANELIISQLVECDHLGKKQYRKLDNEIHNTDCSGVARETILKAESLLAYSLRHPETHTIEHIYGQDVQPWDLKDNIRHHVTVVEEPEKILPTHIWTQQEINAYPELATFPTQGIVIPQRTVTKHQYSLQGLSEQQKCIYEENKMVDNYAPLNRGLYTIKDESCWRPNTPYSVEIKRKKVNEVIGEIFGKKGISQTSKRRDERKRQKQRLEYT
jgi:hypothetical protein